MNVRELTAGGPGSRRLGTLALLLFVSVVAAGGEAGAGQRRLFAEPRGQALAEVRLRRAEVRGRRVQVDLSALAGADLSGGADAIALNLFADVSLTAKRSSFERRESGQVVWTGKVADDPLSMAVLVARDGLMAGSVFAHGKHYAIRGSDADSQTVVEIDQSAFPREACDKLPAGDAGQAAFPGQLLETRADSGATIDVMVVYTPSVRAAQGGTAAMDNLIALAVAQTNASYASSSITPRLNLVHAAEVTYTESGDWDLDLSRLQGTSDGYMDSVHTLRNQYYADVVVLLINDLQYCGLAAAVMADATSAFALVAYDCATGNYSFGHEIGHLQGAMHDWYEYGLEGYPASPFGDNHGDIDLTSRQRTMMSYNDQCQNTSPFTFCTRVPYWSNPNVNYPNTATTTPAGSAIENNARVLNYTASTVANFRPLPQYVLTVTSSYPTAGVAITVSPTDVNGDGSGTTGFTRTYEMRTVVTLTAPSSSPSGNAFSSWSGCTSTSGTLGEVCSVSIGGNVTVQAKYTTATLTVASTFPAAGVSITVSPTDVDGLGSGSTTLTRNYYNGTVVTLTAPSTGPAAGNAFSSWSGCTSTSGTLEEVCSVTISGNQSVRANYAAVSTVSVLWTAGANGRASVWELDATTRVLQRSFYLHSYLGVGSPWKATSYVRVDDTTAYVLWTRSDVGRASLWKIDPSAAAGSPLVVPIAASAYLYSSTGVGASWQATSYEPVSATEGYVLWTRSDSGKASLWRIDPSGLGTLAVLPLTNSAYLYSSAGVGSPWQATSFTRVDASTAYVLWTRSDVGKASLWQIDPSGLGTLAVLPVTNSAYLYSSTGVGAPWQATSYAHVGSGEGYVLWTRSDLGKASLWQIDPGGLGTLAVLPIANSGYLDPTSGVGAPWEAESYVR